MIGNFWNGKLLGCPGAIFLIVKRTIEVISDKISTFFFTNNIEKCGRNVIVRRGVQYRLPKNIFIGDNVEIGKNVIFSSEILTGSLNINNNVVIGRNCSIDFSGGLIIKNNSLLSEGVIIQTHDHGLDPRSIPVGKSLIINENCWIGLNVMILSNVEEICQNVIIGANSLVTKSINEPGVYGGNPLRKLK